VEDGQAGGESSYTISPLVTQGESLSHSEELETLANNLEALFQPLTDHSVSAVTETADVALRSYSFSPASEPQLTTTDVHEAIRILTVSKVPDPNGVPNRALKHLPMRAVSLLVRMFNTVLRNHHFPQTWKHAQVISIFKPGEGLGTALFLMAFSLLDMIGKLIEKILLPRILHVLNERGLMRDERFGFRPIHSTSLQLARLVEGI